MTTKLIKEIKTVKENGIQLFEAKSLSFSNFESKTILFIGVFHGDEPEGEEIIHNLISEINNNHNLMGNNRILFVPCLNPDGKEVQTRTNSNGVDLNRNFPTHNWKLSKEKDSYYSGISPASEIETKFIIEIIEEYKPNAIITLHSPYRVVNYDGPAKELAKIISKFNKYPVEESIGYPTPGSFGTFCGIERNIPTITLEFPDNTCIETLWADNKDAFFEIIKT